MLHAKKFAIVTAYDIYLELSEGGVDPEWKTKPVDFHRFREKLAIQMLAYSPAKLRYPGDSRARATTKLPMKRRHPKHSSSSSVSSVSSEFIQHSSGRICGDLAKLHEHVASVWALGKSGRLCTFCNVKCFQQCGRCNVPLHYHSKPEGFSVPCFFLYHDLGSCGLASGDCKAVGTPKKHWKLSSASQVNNNRNALKSMISSNNNASMMPDKPDGNNDDHSLDGADPNRVI